MKILVINIMHIGDLLLVTPVLAILREQLPVAEIFLLTDKKLEALVVDNTNVDGLILLDKKGYHNNIVNFWQFIRQVRSQQFDLCINLHANERASCIAAFSGAKEVIGYSSPFLGVLFTKKYFNFKRSMHQVHSHMRVVCDWFGWNLSSASRYACGIKNDVENESFEISFCDKSPIVAINAGGSWTTKRWPAEKFAHVAECLLRQGINIIWLGSQADKLLVDEIVEQIPTSYSKKMQIFTGKMTLSQLISVLSQVDVMLTTDSGPMHVAVAVGTPVVSLFGPSPVLGFYPYGIAEAAELLSIDESYNDEKHVVIAGRCDCQPCYQHSCRYNDMRCWQSIDCQEVISAVIKKLAYVRR